MFDGYYFSFIGEYNLENGSGMVYLEVQRHIYRTEKNNVTLW